MLAITRDDIFHGVMEYIIPLGNPSNVSEEVKQLIPSDLRREALQSPGSIKIDFVEDITERIVDAYGLDPRSEEEIEESIAEANYEDMHNL